jgi:diguanylate cyclase (GGDEF)-like protein
MEQDRANPENVVPEEYRYLLDRVNLLESVVENFPGGLLLFDKDLMLIFCNRRQRQMLGYPNWFFGPCPPSIEEIFWFNAKRGEYGVGDPLKLVEDRMALVARREEHVFERRRPNGNLLEIRGRPLEGGGFVTTYLDITEQRKGQEALHFLAHHDVLTNLPNRFSATEKLRAQIEGLRQNETLAVVFLDLDGFKPINDRHGHAVGDEVLRVVASRLLRSVRESDSVSRYGGDEFIILMNRGSGYLEAEALVARLKAQISETMAIEGYRLSVSASFGIALCPHDGSNVEGLVKVADQRMLQSKRIGKSLGRNQESV